VGHKYPMNRSAGTPREATVSAYSCPDTSQPIKPSWKKADQAAPAHDPRSVRQSGDAQQVRGVIDAIWRHAPLVTRLAVKVQVTAFQVGVLPEGHEGSPQPVV
jgi:hypothetical protein